MPGQVLDAVPQTDREDALADQQPEERRDDRRPLPVEERADADTERACRSTGDQDPDEHVARVVHAQRNARHGDDKCDGLRDDRERQPDEGRDDRFRGDHPLAHGGDEERVRDRPVRSLGTHRDRPEQEREQHGDCRDAGDGPVVGGVLDGSRRRDD